MKPSELIKKTKDALDMLESEYGKKIDYGFALNIYCGTSKLSGNPNVFISLMPFDYKKRGATIIDGQLYLQQERGDYKLKESKK